MLYTNTFLSLDNLVLDADAPDVLEGCDEVLQPAVVLDSGVQGLPVLLPPRLLPGGGGGKTRGADPMHWWKTLPMCKNT